VHNDKHCNDCEKGTRHRSGTTSAITAELDVLIHAHAYTLECGASWQHEKGNKKINQKPKSIASLITNLNNAVNNTAANGYASISYHWEEAEA
jgi:hypothetical protein